MLWKIYLLSWKNLLHFKRHIIVTAGDIILPCLLIMLVAFFPPKKYKTYYFGSKRFPEYSETALIGQLADQFIFYPKHVILYTPKSEAAERIIGKFVNTMGGFLNETGPRNETKQLMVNITDFPDEDEMVRFNSLNMMKLRYKNRSEETLNITFGLVFDGLNGNEIGPNVSYKIRMNCLTAEESMKSDVADEYKAHQCNRKEFIGIQYLIDKMLIEEYTNKTVPPNMFILQSFPYPGKLQVNTWESFFVYFPLILVTGFVFIVPQVVRGVVSEKETGIRELMKMSGLPEWMHWFGWMLNSLKMLTLTTIIIVYFLCFFPGENYGILTRSDYTLVWAVLMIYVIWAITYCFMVAACFEKPALATTFGILIWLVSIYGLGSGMQDDFSTEIKLLLCLFPNVAIYLAFRVIGDFEVADIGSKWGNINQTVVGTINVPLLYIIFMFLASICLNMIICLYLEAVLPKTYGVRKPFYFLFLPSEWGFSNRVSPSPLANNSTSVTNTKPGFEDDPRGIKAGIQIKNLRKEFGNGKVAVNDVSMNIFEGQIFCLLGQNGAGKTTTMSILTGLIAPTAGTAFIGGYDIRTNMNKIRESVGLCPQHNMLFDEMTVIEHLTFFGMMKGLSLTTAEREGKKLVGVLQMEDKKHEFSKSLSGGQKRRLSLGCALIGGSKAIFLDEPTSGMDPEARRVLWDILLKFRGERTIVLTTHFMEEADVLGDRIAILANGTLQCCGTPNFLKRFYGAGFTLNMTTMDGANREEILLTVCKHIEDAYFKASHSNNETELSIVIPSDFNTTAKFPDLFSELRREQTRLQIDEIGVGWSTMDEVFVRVEELNHEEGNTNSGPSIHQNGARPLNEFGPNHDKLTGLKLSTNQFYGLLIKKLMYILRTKRLVITQMLIPVFLTIAAIYIGNAQYVKYSSKDSKDSKSRAALKMSISSYKNPVTLYSSQKKELGDTYAKVVGSSAQLLDPSYNNSVSDGLLQSAWDDMDDYNERYIVAAELNDTNMKGMYSTNSTLAYQSASLSLNLLTNTYLQSKGTGGQVEIIDHPFPDALPHNISDISMQFFSFEIDETFPISFAALLQVGLTLLLGSFIIGPTEERINKGKQLQLMTGVNPFLYWSSTFLCDMLLVLISSLLITTCLPIFEQNKMFTNHDGAEILFLILMAYGFASISISYFLSIFVSGVTGGFTLITNINIFAGVGLYLVETAVKRDHPRTTLFLQISGKIFPSFAFTRASIDYVETSSHNSLCYNIPKKQLDFVCNPDSNVDWLNFRVHRICCENCADFGECFETRPYFRWSMEKKRYGAIYPAITQYLVLLILMAVGYFAILMLIDYGVFKKLLERVCKQDKADFITTVDDNDVFEENERVNQLVKTANSSEDALVVDNLCKSYGHLFSAVSKLSFGVHHGECFGLLGVNGAGKTTTFRMLTGDENRSNGNAYIKNLSLSSARKQFLSMLGYCPQFDGFVECLSGKEMLRLFARLRGVPGSRVEKEADKWLEKTGLTASANVQCKKYSGGMKRRLSAAMALIGDPAVILLDEPTSGVDPVARRQFWKIISSIKNSDQAIILTSHSMEECEAICSRLGIMVNGEMQCLGGVQHLKNKFAQGYSLTLKLKENTIHEDGNVVQVITDRILQNFESSSLKDHHQTTMKFQIHSQSLLWEELYGRMERIKTDFQEVIEEYAITETTLEEVFLSFARKQNLNDRSTLNKGIINTLFGSCVSRDRRWQEEVQIDAEDTNAVISGA